MVIVTAKRSESNIGDLFGDMNVALSVFPHERTEHGLVGESKVELLFTSMLAYAQNTVIKLAPSRALLYRELVDHNGREGCAGAKHTCTREQSHDELV